MFNLFVDVPATTAHLRTLIDDTDSEIARHQRESVGFDSAAAGRDFAEFGDHLDRMFAAVHERNLSLMQRAVSVATAAHSEITGMGSADDANAAELGAIARKEGVSWEN